MAVQQFPDTAYFKVINNGLTEKIGSFSLDEATELTHIVPSVLWIGTPLGSEQFRIAVYLDQDLSRGFTAISDWRDLSDFVSSGNRYGRLRFDFNRIHLRANLTYYLGVQSQNYTRTTTDYLAFKLDWPDFVYDANVATQRGSQIRIAGYR